MKICQPGKMCKELGAFKKNHNKWFMSQHSKETIKKILTVCLPRHSDISIHRNPGQTLPHL